ncbi:MAG TPA: hypothetical protein VGL89_05325 [Candidatus Koribacter sp.]|jgi:hypothetical protein
MRHAFLCAVILLVSSFVLSQLPTPERPRCVFFSNLDREETQQKINDYAAQGYRLAGLQFNQSRSFVVAMEDQSAASETRYEYKLLEGHWQHVLRDKFPMLLQVNELGAQGYRIVRGSLLFLHPMFWAGEINERALAMERLVGSQEHYEYRSTAPSMIGNAQKDLQAGLRDGYELLISYSFVGNRLLLFEKGSDTVTKVDSSAIEAQKSHSIMDTLFDVKTYNGSISSDGLAIRNMKPGHVQDDLAGELNGGMHILTIATCRPQRAEAVLAAMKKCRRASCSWWRTKAAKTTYCNGR